MNTKTLRRYLGALAFFLLVISEACSSRALTPIPTRAASLSTLMSTATLTDTPTQTATLTPTATSTPEIEYPVCAVEHYRDCYIPPNDLLNGDYLRWLLKLSKPFANLPDFSALAVYGGDPLFYQGLGGSPFSKTAPPIRKGATFGWTKGKIQFGDGTIHDWEFAVTPVEFAIPNKPTETKWVVFVQEGPGYNQSEAMYISVLKLWVSGRSLLIGGFERPANSVADVSLWYVDTIKRYPNLVERLDMFRKTLDATYISEPGIVLVTAAVR